MKNTLQKIRITGLLLLLMTGYVLGQAPGYPVVPLDSVNFVPLDSLKIADSLGATGRVSLTASRYLGDTVTITGIVIADPGITINGTSQYSSNNTDFYIQSTDSAQWGGMNIFGLSTVANSIGLSSIDTGYVIKLTGVVNKTYYTSIVSNVEMGPIAGQTIGIVGIQNRPAPVEVKMSDLVNGDKSSGGKMYFNPGTKYKNSYVIVRNLIVKTRTQNSSSGQWTWTVEDSLGNTIDVYDPSKYFTGRSWHVTPAFVPPAIGSKIDFIRGILGAYVSYGYEIIPLYPGDVQVGTYTPSITATGFSSRRSPSIPTSSDPVKIRVVAVNPDPNAASTTVDSTVLYYSINNGSYVRVKMTADTSNSYVATIPPQADGAFVKYFFAAWQDSSLALTSHFPDTSKTALFYYVRSNGYTIKDIQYTPYSDGNSGVADLPVAATGTVQADTSDYPAEIDHENQSTKTPYVYIQDAAAPWSGIMLYDTTADKLSKGELATVFGKVSMYNGMTEISVDSTRIGNTRQTAPYSPVKIKTGDIGQRANGDSLARRWQGVLVEFDSVRIVDNDPDGPSYSINSQPYGSFREYMVADTSSKCRVDDDGSNTYSVDPHDTLWGFHIMPEGAFIRSLIGIVKYKNSEYKLEPRTNSDFVGEVDAVKENKSSDPASFSLLQNYPNPFNPTTSIRYSIAKASIVSLKIYNILGQEVATLVNQHQTAGDYTTTFDASRYASGVYFYRLNAGGFRQVRKMLLLK